MPASVIVRPAAVEDVGALLGLIRDLAAYEREPDAVEADERLLASALFAGTPSVFAHVAEDGAELVGMAIWFVNFSTWTGRNGIYLEDLFVRPAHRGRGIGRALLAELATIAGARGYARIDWSVLVWNQSAIRFYQSLAAVPMDEWTGYRLSGEALAALGSTDHWQE